MARYRQKKKRKKVVSSSILSSVKIFHYYLSKILPMSVSFSTLESFHRFPPNLFVHISSHSTLLLLLFSLENGKALEFLARRENLLRNRASWMERVSCTQVTDDFIIVKLNVLYHRNTHTHASRA